MKNKKTQSIYMMKINGTKIWLGCLGKYYLENLEKIFSNKTNVLKNRKSFTKIFLNL
jgi:hypothetical protein